MSYRVTVTLGRAHLDRDELLHEARALDGALDAADVSLDPVKAALQVAAPVEAPDALTAASHGLRDVAQACARAGLEPPRSIVHVEAEAVPAPAEGGPLTETV